MYTCTVVTIVTRDPVSICRVHRQNNPSFASVHELRSPWRSKPIHVTNTRCHALTFCAEPYRAIDKRPFAHARDRRSAISIQHNNTAIVTASRQPYTYLEFNHREAHRAGNAYIQCMLNFVHRRRAACNS